MSSILVVPHLKVRNIDTKQQQWTCKLTKRKHPSLFDSFQTKCFICGIGNDYFDRTPHGFETHTLQEHNLANYLWVQQQIKVCTHVWSTLLTPHVAPVLQVLPDVHNQQGRDWTHGPGRWRSLWSHELLPLWPKEGYSNFALLMQHHKWEKQQCVGSLWILICSCSAPEIKVVFLLVCIHLEEIQAQVYFFCGR